MIKAVTIIYGLVLFSIKNYAQDVILPDTVTVVSDKLTLTGLLWRAQGEGPFPTVIFCHGSYESNDSIYDPVQQTSLLGPLFAKKGYIFFGLFRRGVGLSKAQGVNSADLMAKAFEEKGIKGRNDMQLSQLQTDQLKDMFSGLAFLRKRKDVDTSRMAVVGHSFGGSLALLLAERDHLLKSIVIFGVAGYSWDRSPQLRTRLSDAVKNISSPVMIVHAQNDYSIHPGVSLDSLMNQNKKAHLLKIYPPFGVSQSEGHNLIFLSPATWETDVFTFLHKSLQL